MAFIGLNSAPIRMIHDYTFAAAYGCPSGMLFS
jgi:hypothetical protein